MTRLDPVTEATARAVWWLAERERMGQWTIAAYTGVELDDVPTLINAGRYLRRQDYMRRRQLGRSRTARAE